MPDEGQDTDINNGLCLEDISRRLACDRCKGMKMRCERSHKQYIVQLQQCRRCRQAHVRCITTLEAQQHQNDDADKPSQRNRKRCREPSIETNSSYPVPETLESLDQQHHNALLEHRPERITAEMPSSSSMPADSKPEDGLLPSREIDYQWHELSKMIDLEGSAIYNLDDGQSRATAVPPTSNVAISSPNHNPDSGPFVEAMAISSATVQSIPEATQFNQTQQESCNLFWNSLPPLSSSDLSGTQTPQTEANRTIMNKLMDFNTKVSHDLQDIGEVDQARGDDKSMLVKTLQHSNMFLELLGSLTRLREAPDRSSPYSGSAESRHVGSTLGRGEKVDTDIALLLLSCNMNVGSMYEILCVELTTQGLQLEEAQALLALRLGGLQSLDIEMRIQVLVHICSLTFIKIQKELKLIRQRGLLTQTAEKAFQVVLGEGNGGAWSLVFNMEQMMDNFRRLVTARRLSS